MAKNKPAPEAPKDKRILTVRQTKDEDPDEALSKTLLKPEVTAAFNIQTWEPLHTIEGLRAALTQQIDEVHGGSMKRPEAMLLSQAHTLDALFNNLAQRAHGRETVSGCESYLRLALKAQAQCRATLETLSNIKNPPVIFAKQANISNGHQQINNGTPAPATQTEKNDYQQNELLEHTHGERLDTRTKSAAIGVNTELAALG